MLGKVFLTSFLCLCLSFWGLLASSKHRLAAIKLSANAYQPPPLSELSPNQINILTLGHKPLYDNFINLWLLQALIKEEKHDPSKADDLYEVIESVIRHNPPIETLYMLSCFVMAQDFQRPERCQTISLAGLKALPRSWRIPMTQGYIHAFITKEPAQAASFFLMAASRESSPTWVRRVATKLIKSQQISPDDLQKGLELIKDEPAARSFFEILNKRPKSNSPG